MSEAAIDTSYSGGGAYTDADRRRDAHASHAAQWIMVGFQALTAIVWIVFEQWRFRGPLIGEMIANRQAAIVAAEKAFGEA
jgi:hypothetical protein